MPRYPYRDLGVKFDRNFRNALNANFDDIEVDIKGVQSLLNEKDSAAQARMTRIENDSIERDNDLDARIDNIVANVGGSNTEIVDARHDSINNVTYPTLKGRLDDTSNKIGILSRNLEDIASRVGGGIGGALEAQSIKLGTHLFKHYQIPGEDTELVTVERDGESYTIFEIVAPTREVNGNVEATLTLMRRKDPDTGAPEFMDLYNVNYPDGKQMGIRIQTRGPAGTLRDFVIDFNRGQGVYEAMRVKPDKDIIYHGNARYRSADDQIIEFQDINGNRAAYFGRKVSTPKKMVLLVNSVGGNSVELHDNGSTVFYSPSGDFYVYLDAGSMFVNDSRVQTQGYTTLKSPDGSIWKAEIDNSGTVTWVKQGPNTVSIGLPK